MTRLARSSALVLLLGVLALALGCGRAAEAPEPEAGTETVAAESEASRPEGVDSIGPGAAKRLYYQYIDEKGSVRFTDRLEDVPDAWRDKVGFVELDGPPPASPSDAQRSREQKFARTGRTPFRGTDALAEVAAPRGPDVTLYFAEWCPHCKRARAHLDRRGIDYELKNIDEPDALEELVRRTGQQGIPVIDINGRVLIGYDASRLDSLLDATG